MNWKFLQLLTLVVHLCGGVVVAQNHDPSRLQPSGKYRVQPDQPVEKVHTTIQSLGNGRYRLGSVSIDANKREVRIPVALGVTDTSPLEYALVHAQGKTHESLLITDVTPELFHIAALLLSVKEGTPIIPVLAWSTHGPEKQIELSKLIRRNPSNPANQPKAIRWIYGAKLHTNGSLMAQAELNFMALINDPSVLIHHHLPIGQNSDEIYRFNSKHRLPKKGLPMTLIVKFPITVGD